MTADITLFAQIFVGLLIAFLLGLILGLLFWWWRRRTYLTDCERVRLESEAQVERLKLRVGALEDTEDKLNDAEEELSEVRAALEDDSGDDADDSDDDDEAKGHSNDDEIARLNARIVELEALLADSGEHERQISALTAEVDKGRRFQMEANDLRERTSSLESDLAAARKDLESCRSDVERYSDKLGETEQQLDDLRAQANSGEADDADVVDDAGDTDTDTDTDTGEAEAEALLANFVMPEDSTWKSGELTAVGTPAATHDDDLKKINGIGPVMEKTLNELGIRTWEQIAAFTTEDIERVSGAITSFGGRIERDDWIGGAKELLARGHTPGEDTSRHKMSSYRGPRRKK